MVHVLNCEAVGCEVITLALLADEPLLPAIHPERAFGKLFQLERLPFDDLLGYYRLRRSMLVQVLRDLPLKKWGRMVREEGKQRRETVYWQARAMALHESEHVQAIDDVLSAA